MVKDSNVSYHAYSCALVFGFTTLLTTAFWLAWHLQDSLDTLEVEGLVQGLTEVDSRYLVEKLYNMTVNQSYMAAQKELAVKEMEAKLNEVLQYPVL